MKLPEPCATHITKPGGYFKNEDRWERAMQCQCPHCFLWFFHGEFGRGWAKGLKPGDHINNILKP